MLGEEGRVVEEKGAMGEEEEDMRREGGRKWKSEGQDKIVQEIGAV